MSLPVRLFCPLVPTWNRLYRTMQTQGASGLPATLLDQVLPRLGLARPPAPDLAGLRQLYLAGCASVPFDNVRKMIALATGQPAPLPGTDAREFFEAWLDHGVGSMRDLGIVSHGSVKVRIEGRDWLVDSSMLTNEPLPLGDSVFVQSTALCAAEVEPAGETHLVWAEFPPGPDPLPCRLLVDPADFALHASRYEASRDRSPFDERLYARRNRSGEVLVLVGNTRHSRTSSGLASHDCSRGEVCRSLRDEFGISAGLIQDWVEHGCLEASFAPPSGPKPPPVGSRPPSRRSGV